MPKDAPFDPCRQWLGIDAVELGNARLVLGVSPQETDPAVVLRAAEARLNLLRTISPGPFEMARAGLIKRVEEAREKLLADIAASPPRPGINAAVTFAMPAPPSQRTGGATVAPTVLPGAVPSVPPAVPFAAPAVPPTVPPPVPGEMGRGVGGGVETIAIRTTVYRKKTPVAGIALTVLALSAAAGGLVYYTMYGKPRSGGAKAEKSGARETARADLASKPGGAKAARPGGEDEGGAAAHPSDPPMKPRKPPATRRDGGRPSRPQSEPEQVPQAEGGEEPAMDPPQAPRKPEARVPVQKKSEKEMPEKEMPAEDQPAGEEPEKKPSDEPTAEENRQLDTVLAEALEALRRQEYDTVTELLAKASRQARGNGPDQRVANWKLLATYYKGFLEYREKALAAVKPGDEYDVKNQRVGVVEVDDEKFIYHVAGGNKTVARDKIPGGIVLAIVMKWFDANPANDLYVGAYHLAKPESDPPRAREHWEKAMAGGADASGLVPLLEDPVFTRSE